MTVKLTKEVINIILEGAAKVEQCEVLGGDVFIKFDSFVVTSNSVEFSYKGTKTFYLDHHAQINRGENLTVTGVEGKMGVKITTT